MVYKSPTPSYHALHLRRQATPSHPHNPPRPRLTTFHPPSDFITSTAIMSWRSEAIEIYGWTAHPRDPSVLLEGKKNLKAPQPLKVDDIELPDTQLAKEVLEYAKRELREETFNHSMRVYYYGIPLSPFSISIPTHHHASL